MTYFRLPFIVILALAFMLPASAFAASSPTYSVQLASSPANANLTVGHLRKVPAPTCDVHASRTKMRSGDTTRFTWKSKNADAMTGLTKDHTYPAKGRENIAIGFVGTFDFTLTFTGPGGTTTCSRAIKVLPKKS